MENLSQFNLVDVVALIYIVLGTLRGLGRGLSGELAQVLGAVAVVVAAFFFYEPAGRYLLEHTRAAEWGEPAVLGAAFATLLVAGWLLARVLRLFLRNIMEFTFRGPLERVGGLLAGFLRHAAIAGALLLLLGFVPNETMARWVVDESFLGRLVARYGRPAYEKLANKHPILRLPGRPPAEDQPSVEKNVEEEPARE